MSFRFISRNASEPEGGRWNSNVAQRAELPTHSPQHEIDTLTPTHVKPAADYGQLAAALGPRGKPICVCLHVRRISGRKLRFFPG